MKKMNDHEIKPGKKLKVNVSIPNLRLFVGNIPKSKSKDEILEEFRKIQGACKYSNYIGIAGLTP